MYHQSFPSLSYKRRVIGRRDQEFINRFEAVERALRPALRPFWRHYFFGNGSSRTLQQLGVMNRFLAHPNVRRAVRSFELRIGTQASGEIGRRCRANSEAATRFNFRFDSRARVNVISDPDLTGVGRGTLTCRAHVRVNFDCPRQVFSLRTLLQLNLDDTFEDVRDLRSNQIGNQELPLGRAFPLRAAWEKPFMINRAAI